MERPSAAVSLYVIGAEVGSPKLIEEPYTPDETDESSYGVKLTIHITVDVWLADTPP